MGLTFCRPSYTDEREPYHQQLPRMMMDFEINSCYLCSVPFDMLVRRHHCRRCRNIYCRDCSSQSGRLLLYGVYEPVRLCNGCADVTPAENYFVECYVPLLVDGATLVKRQEDLLSALGRRRRQLVHIRVTADLSTLEETQEEEEEQEERKEGGAFSFHKTGGGNGVASAGGGMRRGVERWGVTRHHPLIEVESVDSVMGASGWGGGGGGGGEEGASAALVIRLREKGQLKLEACSPSERDRWVSALGEAVRRARAPPLAAEVEEERWHRREEAAAAAQRMQNAQRRRENEASRAGIAAKYGLDPGRYSTSSRRGGSGSGSGSGSAGVGGGWGSYGSRSAVGGGGAGGVRRRATEL